MRSIRYALLALPLAACSGTGEIAVTTYGEDYIEQKIPAEDFADGWEVTFSRFLVAIGHVKVSPHDGEPVALVKSTFVYDVHQPGPIDVMRLKEIPAGEYPHVSYAIAPSANPQAGNATAADVKRMKDEGLSIYVEGTAKKDDRTKSFRWGFKTNTLYENCHSEELGAGISVPSGDVVTAQITIHGDHLFFDDLQSPDAVMRFDEIAAADANADGEVTLEELAAIDLTTLPNNRFGTGGAPGVDNLAQFVTAHTRTLGHWQGEGECQPRSR